MTYPRAPRSNALHLALLLGGLCLLPNCMSPPSQAERVTDAARELNLATRFGRMDIALGHTAKGARGTFLERRNRWGKDVRIVDVELAGLSMQDKLKATIQVDVAWVRNNDATLRSTRLAQVWRDDGGWQLVREQRLAGDMGLFGEQVTVDAPAPRDVQFPTRVIH